MMGNMQKEYMQLNNQKKNIVFILADGLSESMIDLKISGKNVCPFLHELGEKNIRFDNVYSQGTYTMSAVNSLFTGEDIIHGNIYDSFFNSHEESVFDVFFNERYETFITMLGFGLPAKRVIDNTDHLYLFDEEDAFRYYKYYYDYYRDLVNNGSSINKNDLDRLYYFFDALFEGTSPLFEIKDSVSNLWRNEKNYPWGDYTRAYKIERDCYYSNKSKYVNEVLFDNKHNSLFDTSYKITGGYLPKQALELGEKYYELNKRKIKQARIYQIIRNGLHNGIPIGAYVDYLANCVIGNQASSSGKEKLISYLMRVFGDCNTRKSFSYDSRENKELIVAENMLSRMARDIKKRDREKPFFSYIHLEDTHQPFDYFSLLDEHELITNADRALRWTEDIGLFDTYKGSYAYLLSASYVDRCLERFVNKLKESGDLENTLLVITSDHGTVYGNSPIRGLGQANNFHEEGYHIPCIIVDYSSPLKHKSHSFYESKDIFPTIFSLAGITPKKQHDGIDMLSGITREYAHSEHLGAGVADIYRKPILYTIRNDEYLAVCRASIYENVGKENIIALYELKNDKNELHNKKRRLDNNKCVIELLDIISDRHNQIRNEYFTF